MNEFTDLFAGLTTQLANVFKIQKKSLGWFLTMSVILYWIARTSQTGFQSQMFWNIVSFLIASYGFYNWRKT